MTTMKLQDFHTDYVVQAMQESWNIYLADHPGNAFANTSSRFVGVYAGLVQGRKAALRAGGSAKGHLYSRAIRHAGAMMDADLKDALDRRLKGAGDPIADLDALNAPLAEAQAYFGLDSESRAFGA